MSWLPCSYVHEGWSRRSVSPSGERSQASLRVIRVKTIKSSTEISALFKSGTRSSNRFLTLIFAPVSLDNDSSEHGPCGRVAFIAGKKSGNACWRNAAKRRMREIARQIDAPWNGYEVLFVAKKSIIEAPYDAVLKATRVSAAKIEQGMVCER